MAGSTYGKVGLSKPFCNILFCKSVQFANAKSGRVSISMERHMNFYFGSNKKKQHI